MKKFFRMICLLLLAGILFIGLKSSSYASRLTNTVDSHLTGETESRTNIEDAGTAETPEDLKELNISNDLTITYNDGNGQLSGSLRILLTLTLIAIAPLLLLMLTCFTRAASGTT